MQKRAQIQVATNLIYPEQAMSGWFLERGGLSYHHVPC